MGNFVVSARKYRPIRFDSVVGQQHVSQTLKSAIQNDHLAQAFLFCGPRGVGKTTCARILAKVLNCEQPTEDMEPCDSCESCQSFNKNTSLNIHELDAASNNSVEHIRALIEQVRYAPQSGQYKIYIIDEVHMLSQSAFNAFLKTLEEPPAYAIFILATTEKHKIIPTILSRCQIFDFNRIQVPDMVAHLQHICAEEDIEAEEEALTIIAQKADGALRDSLSIFDRIVSFAGNKITYKAVIENLNILDYDYFFKVVDAILMEDASQLLLLYNQISRKGFDGDIFINGLAEHLRNLLVCKDKQTIELLEVTGNIRERYEEQAAIVPLSLVLSALSISNDCDVNYNMARNKRLHVEMALIKMAYIKRAMQPPAISVEKKTADQSESGLTAEEQAVYQTSKSSKEVEAAESKSDSSPIPQKEEKKTKEKPSSNEEEEEEEEEEAKPKEKEAPSKKGNNFSKKFKKKSKSSILSKLKNAVSSEEEDDNADALPFTKENIQHLWDDYTQGIESRSMKILFNSATFEPLADATPPKLQITCSGSRAKDAILREHLLKQLIIDKFKIKNLIFEIKIDKNKIEKPKPKKVLPQTPRDKYVHFLQMNPTLKEFQKRFELYPPKNQK